jgi:N6-L-threonylcarbamoyladenine synthase
MSKEPTILSIETSLDDTCAAVTIGRRVISNVVSSQTSYHASWGGTVPDIAKRLREWLPKVINSPYAKQAPPNSMPLPSPGPGLAPSLEQGIALIQDVRS